MSSKLKGPLKKKYAVETLGIVSIYNKIGNFMLKLKINFRQTLVIFGQKICIFTLAKRYLTSGATRLGVLITLVLLSCNLISAKEYLIDLTKSTIYVDSKADQIKQFAAKELQKHLDLITGGGIPIVHSKQALKGNNITFMVGVVPKSKRSKKMKPEMANYMYDARHKRLYLWGDDRITSSYSYVCASSRNRTGTLSAVYDFLRFELGVKWIKPGDDGICYHKQHKLNLKHKDYSWAPTMLFSGARIEAWRQRVLRQCYAATPPKIRVTAAFLTKKYNEDMIWQRRMKFSNARRPAYYHAFTQYWKKYGKQHPEWFALGKNGKRGVAAGQRASYLKLCVSNPKLLDAIVAEWRAKWLKDKSYNIYNACPNDSEVYCRCKKCCALDVKASGAKSKGDTFESDSKSDRYVYFWNELLKRAKKFNPQAKVIVYIYADYRYAPRKQILSDGVICGFVPRFMDRPAETKKVWAQWKKMGMKEVFLRPNDFNDSVGMPMGNSRYIYDKFALSKKYKLVGTDYDRAYNALDAELDGLAFYVLGQSFNHPDKSYNELADEFFSTFENAKADIREYYRYWIKLFEQKRLPKIQLAGGFEGRRYMFNNLANFYQYEDFIKAHQILLRALKNNLPARIRKNIDSLILANEHSKLLYQAITCTTIEGKIKAAQALYNFRLKNKTKLSSSLSLMFGTESSFNDITGIKTYVMNAKSNSVHLGKNMVKNGDFQQGRKNWSIPQKDKALFSLFPVATGKGAYLKVIGARTPDGYSRISNLIKGADLKPGDEVIIKAKIKCDKLTGKFEAMLRQADNKNSSLRYSGFSFSKSAAFGWKDYSKKIKIRARATAFYIYLIATNLASDDAVYITDISIRKIK
jgi:Domain of unknown function (DUF4838)